MPFTGRLLANILVLPRKKAYQRLLRLQQYAERIVCFMKPIENINLYEEPSSLPYLLFRVGKNIYGINSEFVRGIETLEECTPVVDFNPNMRGVVYYQNRFIPLLDMRKLFGLPSQIEEFEKSVNPEQRIKDHENWVAALERSVRERTPFLLTGDPHLCAFGKWYYAFKTDNHVLKHQLGAIEAPHEAIHNTSKIVKELMRQNQQDEALVVIQEMRDSYYHKTIHILTSLRDIAAGSFRDLYIVIDAGEERKGLIVDSIVGVEDLLPPTAMPESAGQGEYIETLRQRKKDNSVVLVLNSTL